MKGCPEKVLLATDGLESTALAPRTAVDLAGGRGAELRVVHVWHTVPPSRTDEVVRSGLIGEQGGTVVGARPAEGRAIEGIGAGGTVGR